MASPVQYVCWEYARDDGGYSPYHPEESYMIEKAFADNPNGRIVFSHYIIDLANRRQEGLEGFKYKDFRDVKRKDVMISPSRNITAYWLWCMQKKPIIFTPYAVEASVVIELAYSQKTRGSCDSQNLLHSPCKLPYTINFEDMNQTSHIFLTKREIKRVEFKPGFCLQFYLKAQNKPALRVHPALNNHTCLPFGTSLASNDVSSSARGGGVIGSQYPSTSNYCDRCCTSSYASNTLSSSSCSGYVFSNNLVSTGAISGGSSKSFPHTLPNLSYGATGGANPQPYYPVTTSYASTFSTSAVTATGGYSTISNNPLMSVASGSISSLQPSSSHFSPHEPPSTNRKPKSKNQQKEVAVAKGVTPAVSNSVSRKKGPGRPRKKPEGARPSSFDVEVGGKVGSELLMAYAHSVKRIKANDDEPCPICMNNLSEPSGFGDDSPLSNTQPPPPLNVYKLRKCAHRLHYHCLVMYLKNSAKGKAGFQCPTCKKSYGINTGDMPNGSMIDRKTPNALPGNSGCGTIEIVYNFRPGSYNGRQYRCNGFPRICYLPDSPKGNKVLRLLKVAWGRRLTFTIGTSVTTGATDTVVWNEIHHKTDANSNYSGHGYPDPNYLDRVLCELAAQGVQEEQDEELEESNESDIEDEEGIHPELTS